MDVTTNNSKLYSTKLFNVETINYTAVFSVSFIFLLAVKQILKIFFSLEAGVAVLIAFIASTLLSYILESKFVFPKGISAVPKQLLALVFRGAVDFGFYKIMDVLFGNLLERSASFVWLSSLTIIFFFNYFYDRLITFDCLDKAESKCKGKLYKLFFRNRFVLASAFTALISISFLYIVFAIFPFGDGTVMRMDLYHQYGPLFAELYDRVVDGQSFLYSWQSGGGSSFIGNFFNYLSSPLSIIIFLFDKADISFAITALVAIKCVLSAGTFTFYIKKSLGRHSFAAAAFGVFYALSAYFLAYYWNIMWIDGMILLPLIVLGIEQLINKGDCRLYIASLTVLLIANYYMGYMACIFSVLYFLTYFVITSGKSQKILPADTKLTFKQKVNNNIFLNRGLRFAGSSVLVGCICACVLIPVYILLKASSATSDTFPTTFESYFNIIDFLESHLAYLETTIRSSGENVLPNVYCSILTLILVPIYMINPKIKLKEKATYVILLLFFFFSFNNNMLSFIWHAFHFPNDLPFRFSFMYVFILLTIAFKGLMNIKSIHYKDIIYCGFGLILFVSIAQKFMTNKMSEPTIYISIAFVLVWSAILLLLKKDNIKKTIVGFTILAVSFCEIIVSDNNSMVFTQENEEYKSNYSTYTEAVDNINKNDKSFFRTELTYLETRMDPCYYGYNGMSVFSSMAYEKYSALQYNLGMFGNRINSYTYYTQTPVYNMMFNLKYLIETDKDKTLSTEYYTEQYKTKNNETTVYSNDYTLPIGYAASTKLNKWKPEEGDPFEAQGDYFKYATGISKVFKECEYLNTDFDSLNGDDFSCNGTFWFNKNDTDSQYGFIDVTFTPITDGEVYAYITSPDVKSVEFSGDNIESSISQSIEEPYIIDLGYHKAGENVKVSIDGGAMDTDNSYVSMYAYSVDKALFESGYNKLLNSSLNVTSFSDTKISGTINVEENSYFCTSIPYDDGWSIYIDGEKSDVFKIGDSMLTTTIKPGKHTVLMKYSPKGMKYGVIISAVTIAGIAGYYLIRNVKYKKKRHY